MSKLYEADCTTYNHGCIKYSSGYLTGKSCNGEKVNPPIGGKKLPTYMTVAPHWADKEICIYRQLWRIVGCRDDQSQQSSSEMVGRSANHSIAVHACQPYLLGAQAWNGVTVSS